MIAAGTGHRPPKLGGYTAAVERRLRALALAWLTEAQPSKIISGMALGWDLAWAEAALTLGIPVVAAVPFEGQERLWPAESQRRFQRVFNAASERIVICPGGYASWKMQKRNIWMVNHADVVVALWDGSAGGTGNCVQYALSRKRPIVNLWERWKEGAQ